MTRRLLPVLPTRLALCVAVLLVPGLAGCGSDEATDTSDTAAPAAEPTPTPTPTPTPEPTPTEAPRLIAYAGGESPGVEVLTREDARMLRGAPAAFQQFIGDLAQNNRDASTCSAGFVGVTVQTLRTDGFAVGGVNDCGGYAALWAVVDGEWQEVAGTQEAWDCAVLTQFAVPSEVVGDTCYDDDAQEERAYEQA